MTDSFKDIRRRNKVATMPFPGEMWDQMPVTHQLAALQMEAAKFAASTHMQEVGGFQIVIVRDGQEPEVVLSVGKREEKNSGLVVPESGIIGVN